MPPRWGTWALVQAVQLDYEKAPKERAVRLAAPAAAIGDPVRVGVSGVEIEGRSARIVGPVLHVKVKAAQLKAKRVRRVKSA
jgi:hypothetical protein